MADKISGTDLDTIVFEYVYEELEAGEEVTAKEIFKHLENAKGFDEDDADELTIMIFAYVAEIRNGLEYEGDHFREFFSKYLL